MKNFINKIFENHSLIYKVCLYIVSVSLIVYLFPKGGQFKYEFQKGKPWQYDSFYAPFDFAIQKSDEEIKKEKTEIENNSLLYFTKDTAVSKQVKTEFETTFNNFLAPNTTLNINQKNAVQSVAEHILSKIYSKGFIGSESQKYIKNPDQIIALRVGTTVENISPTTLFNNSNLLPFIQKETENIKNQNIKNELISLLTQYLKPNISYDQNFTKKALDEALQKISYTKGLVTEGERIIQKGDIVEGKKLAVLNSLKNELQSQVWSKSNYNWIVLGYSILVALVLLMLLLFLRKYREEIYESNNKVLFIFFNIILMVLLVTMTVKYEVNYIYVIPLCILPIILKAFFDARLGLFTHVLTVLLLGFIVPNSFEFIFLQIITGIVTILTVSELYKRANLFISVGQITLIYMISYFAFSIIQDGNAQQLDTKYFIMFAMNGALSFLSMFLILIYEKTFKLVSDVSLLELSNTNSKLLRELAEKAPGTFQHSLQVANLAEAAANEIGANSMLTRVGALYHDIGKMNNPMFFTENQTTGFNPHSELPPKESANIIINHVLDGIEIAKKNRLPDRIIDFIRTHHGTTLVYYFYKKEEELDPENVSEEDFQYPGPIPFSRETAILMMCDSVEAASKSLQRPTAKNIDDLIDNIISKQMSLGQFKNADITFQEIDTVKKLLKKKLKNIYHLRVEYPK
ncbi:HD family phosphohydrolase [Aureivirga sp. CE67]|uniref:HD family phosphohydrolase n=1 Tax=Aureivirga sp. CE67 TaxID=1788983 RepID=UPI0018CBB7BB|nr:HDIG domain-containing metalloprotein [Aureivirga sp. CE67]